VGSEKFVDGLRVEAVLAIADVVLDEHFALLLERRIDLFAAERKQHRTYFFPVFGAVVGDRSGREQAQRFFAKETPQQFFGGQREQLARLDRCGERFDARPAVGIALLCGRQSLQEEPGCAVGGSGEKQACRQLLGLRQVVLEDFGNAVAGQRHDALVGLAHRRHVQYQLQLPVAEQLGRRAVFDGGGAFAPCRGSAARSLQSMTSSETAPLPRSWMLSRPACLSLSPSNRVVAVISPSRQATGAG
jgi:hypothetical protein